MKCRPEMKDHFERIRELLKEIEDQSSSGTALHDDRDFSGLELPLIIQEVVDDLQPLLSPYEAAFYWYAFRHSIARNGSPHVRLSGKALRRGLVKSSYSTQSRTPSLKERFVRFSEHWNPSVRSAKRAKRTGTEHHIEC